MAEWIRIDVPRLVTELERWYHLQHGQNITTQRILRMTSEEEGEGVKFETPMHEMVKWQVQPGLQLFVIESTVTGAVVPAWSPRPAAPWARFRETLAHPDRHVLLDFVYEAPSPNEQVTIHLFWLDDWTPLRDITPANLVTSTAERYSLQHAFEVPAMPAGVDAEPHRQSLLAIAAFAILAIVFWVVWVIREIRRQRNASRDPVDEAFVRRAVFSQHPEVVEAEYGGKTEPPSIETFLRRLEKQRKIGLTITSVNDDEGVEDDVEVRVRLLVPRTSLAAYERAAIDILIPDGAMEVSSAQIRQRRSMDDPEIALLEALQRIVAASQGPRDDAWYSKILSATLFWGGLILFGVTAIEIGVETKAIVAPLLAAIFLALIWPAALARRALLRRRSALLWPLAALPLFAAILIGAHSLALFPTVSTIGLAAFTLAAFKAVLSQSTGRETAAALQRSSDLIRARDWLRANPPAGAEYDPWLEALDLPTRGKETAETENWGWALMPSD